MVGPVRLNRFNYIDGEDSGPAWQRWIRSFKYMLQAINIEDDGVKYKMLMHYMGDKAQEVYEGLPDPPEMESCGPLISVDRYMPHRTQYEKAVEKLNEHFAPKQNKTYERHMLRLMKQEEGDSIATFAIKLDIQAARCDFGAEKDNQIKDQIIAECRSSALRHEMLKREEIEDLKEILKVAKVFEAVAKQEKAFNIDVKPKVTIEEVGKVESKSSSGVNRSINQNRQYGQNRNANRNQFINEKGVGCHRCGHQGHDATDEKCPARGKTCFNCGGRDHFGRKCRSKKRTRQSDDRMNQPDSKKARSTSDGGPAGQKQEETVKHISENKIEYVFAITDRCEKDEIQFKIGGIDSNAVIDSGSKFNLMDQGTWNSLKAQNVIAHNQRQQTEIVFKAYGGYPLEVIGVFEANIELAGQTKTAEFYMIKGTGKLLIGRDTAEAFGILKITCEVNKVDGIGEMPGPLNKIKGVMVEIPIRDDAKPIIQPYRRVPVAQLHRRHHRLRINKRGARQTARKGVANVEGK